MNEVDRRIEEFAKRKSEHELKAHEVVAEEKTRQETLDLELQERQARWKVLKSELETAIREINVKLEPLDRCFILKSVRREQSPYSNVNFSGNWLAELEVNVSNSKGEVVFGKGSIIVSQKGHVNFRDFDKIPVQLMLDTVTKASFANLLLALLEHSKLSI
jgi:hypothetical protein